VSRSLQACEGAILVVDASQGIQAQTLSNLFLAMDAGLEIIPVLNKIDLPGAEPDRRAQELHELIGAKPEEILRISAKEGTNVPELLEAVVQRVRRRAAWRTRRCAPSSSTRTTIATAAPSQHPRRGRHHPTRLEDRLRRAQGRSLRGGRGRYLQLGHKPTEQLEAVKSATSSPTCAGCATPAPGHGAGRRASRRAALAGVSRYHVDGVRRSVPDQREQFEELRDALAKLQLNDGSLHYEPSRRWRSASGSVAGFWPAPHEIVRERLERGVQPRFDQHGPERGVPLHKTDATMELVENPSLMPHGSAVDHIEEPYVKARIVAPAEYIGAIMSWVRSGAACTRHALRRSDARRVHLGIPLAEIILDFYDKLKTISRGYASLDYEFLEYRPADLSSSTCS